MSMACIDGLLDLRNFVTDEAESHDPYLLHNQIVEKIDNLLKELKRS